MVNNGATNVPINTNAAAGPVGPMAGATPVQNQLGPAQLATQVPIVNAQGQPTVQNLGNVLNMQNGQTPHQTTNGNPNDPTNHLVDAANALKAAGVPPAQIDAMMK
jgi:hypothetical protein